MDLRELTVLVGWLVERNLESRGRGSFFSRLWLICLTVLNRAIPTNELAGEVCNPFA